MIEGGRSDGRASMRRPGGKQPRRPGNKAPKQGTFMQRMEQRWERRRNQGY